MSIIKFLDQFKENFNNNMSFVIDSQPKEEKSTAQKNKSQRVSKEDLFALTPVVKFSSINDIPFSTIRNFLMNC